MSELDWGGKWGAVFLAAAVPFIWGGAVAWVASLIKRRLARRKDKSLPKQEAPPDARVPIYHI